MKVKLSSHFFQDFPLPIDILWFVNRMLACGGWFLFCISNSGYFLILNFGCSLILLYRFCFFINMGKFSTIASYF